ncbi:MAG: hypothetical protein V4584_11805 [Verrucomicrobiota bacterium]
MKRSSLILTHGAVFSIGIAAAMIANSVRGTNDRDTADTTVPATRSSSRTPAGSSESGGISRDGKMKETERSKSGRQAASPLERLGEIVKMTDSFSRQRALMDMIETLGPGQFAEVAGQFRNLDHLGNSRGEYGLILQGWSKLDPLAALDYVGTRDDGRGRGTILETWAGNDAAAAEAWAKANFTGEGPNPYMASIIRGVAGNDLATATRLAEAMPQSNERGQAAGSITDALFQQGVEAAKNYPAGITDEALRGGFVAMIANRLAEKDPDDAARWLASMNAGEDQRRAARRVADALAKEDPTKAAAWLKSLQPEARAEAARGIIPVMSSGDPNKITQTATWVASLAGTPGYDNVVEEFVWSCNTRAPEQSAAWIQGVANPDQQRRLYYRMLGEWSQKDAAAVKQWVAANNVPDDVRRRFLR